MKPLLIGLAGLSGAGKSTVAEHLERQGGVKRFRLDAFYKDEGECPRIGDKPHWDLPESLHLDQVIEALNELKSGNDVWMPVYNRAENRRNGSVMYSPSPIIFAEGLMLFSDPRLRALFDLRLWLEVPEEVALQRRLERQPNYDLDYYRQVALPAQRQFAAAHKHIAHASVDGTRSVHEVTTEIDSLIRRAFGL